MGWHAIKINQSCTSLEIIPKKGIAKNNGIKIIK